MTISKKTFNYLKIDNYHKENKLIEYPVTFVYDQNYNIKINNNFLETNKNNINCFQQDVNASRK